MNSPEYIFRVIATAFGLMAAVGLFLAYLSRRQYRRGMAAQAAMRLRKVAETPPGSTPVPFVESPPSISDDRYVPTYNSAGP